MKSIITIIFNMSIIFFLSQAIPHRKVKKFDINTCELSADLKEEISNYAIIVKLIMDFVFGRSFEGRLHRELQQFVDEFGARPCGSDTLEQAIDYMIELSKKEQLFNISTESLRVPHWTREREIITMVHPRYKNIAMIGLSGSVSTSPEGITAGVVAVRNFQELEKYDDSKIDGKIVLYDPVFVSYNETVVYRTHGAKVAARKGAVASLVRSITPFSINSPHTGSQKYGENDIKIPTASITVEDAGLIRRIVKRGGSVVLNIKMHSKYETTVSRNTVIDYVGREQPHNLVIVSGHIDSVDAGQGVMDDAGGVFISWAVPVILNQLNFRPRRTIRTIFWTAEEVGSLGAKAYVKKHRKDNSRINFIMESDEGTFAPLGLKVQASHEACCIIAEILKLFRDINATELITVNNPGSDIAVITSKGIPGASLYNANWRYFWYHHTNADTIDIQDVYDLDLGAGLWTAVSYIIADLSVNIPR